jgi:hypothetical protein
LWPGPKRARYSESKPTVSQKVKNRASFCDKDGQEYNSAALEGRER